MKISSGLLLIIIIIFFFNVIHGLWLGFHRSTYTTQQHKYSTSNQQGEYALLLYPKEVYSHATSWAICGADLLPGNLVHCITLLLFQLHILSPC